MIAFSARPTRILQEWRIPFAHSRPLELKHNLEHRALEDDIWQVLRKQNAAH